MTHPNGTAVPGNLPGAAKPAHLEDQPATVGGSLTVTGGPVTAPAIVMPYLTVQSGNAIGVFDCGIRGESSENLTFQTNGNDRWRIDANGMFIALSNNAYDIGDSTHQPRTIYIGTSARIGGASGSTLFSGSGAPAGGTGINGDFYFRSDTPATANQRIYVKSAGAWVGIV